MRRTGLNPSGISLNEDIGRLKYDGGSKNAYSGFFQNLSELRAFLICIKYLLCTSKKFVFRNFTFLKKKSIYSNFFRIFCRFQHLLMFEINILIINQLINFNKVKQTKLYGNYY
jgi:hypothetical protein